MRDDHTRHDTVDDHQQSRRDGPRYVR